jgi:hypothetical protein
MTSPPDDTTTDASAIIAALRAERDSALSEKTALAETLAARTAELAKRNAEYSERIEHQAGTVGDNEALTVENQELRAAQAAGLEVLQAMIASPSDTQPVFDLIARQAADLCMVPAATVAIFDGTMLHLATQNGLDPAYASVHATEFPRPVGPDSLMGRTILSRRVEQIEDFDTDPAYGMTRRPGNWSAMAVPLLRYGAPLGVIAVARCYRAVSGQPSETATDLRRAGGDRDYQRGDVSRIADPHERSSGIAGIPGGDQRRAEGHQPILI